MYGNLKKIDLYSHIKYKSKEAMAKYRSTTYDAFDSTYAAKLSELYHRLHNEETKEKFNSFSENLMNETAITRNGLLDATEEYQQTEDSIKFPLDMRFLDAAWNFQQMCLIS